MKFAKNSLAIYARFDEICAAFSHCALPKRVFRSNYGESFWCEKKNTRYMMERGQEQRERKKEKMYEMQSE